MKRTSFVLAVLVAAVLHASAGETKANSPWVGVWQGELDGLPGVTVTLGDDAGELGGTVVFNVIMKEKNGAPHIGGHDAHVLTHTNLHGDNLTFEVIRRGDGRDLHFTIQKTNDDNANLHCDDCGEGIATTEMVRIH